MIEQFVQFHRKTVGKFASCPMKHRDGAKRRRSILEKTLRLVSGGESSSIRVKNMTYSDNIDGFRHIICCRPVREIWIGCGAITEWS
jgi:hypothetical protein